MDAYTFLERFENLTLLRQCEQTMDAFNSGYAKLLGEVMHDLGCMKLLAAIQAAWLQTVADKAQAGEVEQ